MPNRGGGAKWPAAARLEEAVAADTKTADLKTAVPVPEGWLPTASEVKPALDALQSMTSLLPELNAIIAAFADLNRTHALVPDAALYSAARPFE
jgi:hypothetical protein